MAVALPGGTVKPVILVVDDDPDSLELLRVELSVRYGRDYRVMTESSPVRALERLGVLAGTGEEVALILVDQWMPEMSGVDMLATAHRIDRTARRGLLIEWGDRSTARPILNASALGHIDYYVPKPVYLPDERFHRTVTEFLDEWWRLRGRWLEVVRVVGEERDARAHEVRDVLHRNALPVGLYSSASPEGQAILAEVGADSSPLPVVILYNGRVLANPTNSEVADALGVKVRPSIDIYDVAIVGAGPSGLAAGVYAASEGLRAAIIEHEALGGQAGTSSLIRNYLGFPRGITGAELAFRAFDQAWLFGAELVYGNQAVALNADSEAHTVALADGSEVRARAVVLACGVSYRRLGVPALEAMVGAGVFYGAPVAEAPAFVGQHLFVIGGGNSAGQAARHLGRYAGQVTILIRSDSLAQSMSEYLIQEIDAAPNIDVRRSVEVVGGGGDGQLEWLELKDRRTGIVETVPAAAAFVLIGAQPNTSWLHETVARDTWGYVLTGGDVDRLRPGERAPLAFETSFAGVFAVGDVRHGSVKRVASAVGEGSVATRSVHEYLALSPSTVDPAARRS
jgi:thioredoxin reductase (NADPH)